MAEFNPTAETAVRAPLCRVPPVGEIPVVAFPEAVLEARGRPPSQGCEAAEARQTQVCAYLSAILLVGLGLNAWLGYWWADPLAGVAMVPIIAREGIEAMGTYEVGYRKPPQNTRFTKGKSGNPKGRKQGSRNLKTDLFEELGSKVIVKEGGKRRSLTKQQALLKRLVEQGFGGDYKAMALLFGLKAQY